eukprot:scpid52246/ scgid5917/ 
MPMDFRFLWPCFLAHAWFNSCHHQWHAAASEVFDASNSSNGSMSDDGLDPEEIPCRLKWPRDQLSYPCEFEFCNNAQVDHAEQNRLDCHTRKRSIFSIDKSNCPGARPPGRPTIYMPSDSVLGMVRKDTYYTKPIWNAPAFKIHVAWRDPEDSENLMGYRVQLIRGGLYGPADTFDLAKELTETSTGLNQVVLGLDTSGTLSPGNALTLLPSHFLSEDFFAHSVDTLYGILITSLPVPTEDSSMSRAHVDFVRVNIPSCSSEKCFGLPEQYLQPLVPTCSERKHRKYRAPRKFCTCAHKHEKTEEVQETDNATLRDSMSVTSVDVTTRQHVVTSSLNMSSNSSSRGKTNPPALLPESESILIPAVSAIAGSALMMTIVCLAMLYWWQRHDKVRKWNTKAAPPHHHHHRHHHYAAVNQISTSCMIESGLLTRLPSTSTDMSDDTNRSLPDACTTEGSSLNSAERGTTSPSPAVYISYSRFTESIKLDAIRLYSELCSRGFHAILDVYHQNDIADDREGWISEQMTRSQFVIVLLDEYYPLNFSSATLRNMLESEQGGHYNDAVIESRVLQAGDFGGSAAFSVLPVCIGGALSGRRSVLPVALRTKTLYRLPQGFTTGMCQQLQQLLNRLLATSCEQTFQSEDL